MYVYFTISYLHISEYQNNTNITILELLSFTNKTNLKIKKFIT